MLNTIDCGPWSVDGWPLATIRNGKQARCPIGRIADNPLLFFQGIAAIVAWVNVNENIFFGGDKPFA